MKTQKGFTLMELLIVIALIAVIAIVSLFTLNPKGQADKALDSQKKTNLSQLKKILEDWYNDKNRYPLASEICTDTFDVNNACPICGTESTPEDFKPYLTTLPCDPKYPDTGYLYQVDNTDNPHWYRIYTNLSNTTDPEITNVGCDKGCGPPPNYSYNYGVTSSNIDLEKRPNP